MDRLKWDARAIALACCSITTACSGDGAKGGGPEVGEPCVRCNQAWSEAETWDGRKPAAHDTVTIPAGVQIVLDEDTPNLGGLIIDGELQFARQDLELTADWIVVHGTLAIGTEEEPFTQRATITLDGEHLDEDVMGMGTRGLLVMGGKLQLYGTSPTPVWTRLAENAESGAARLTLAEDVAWQPGDGLVVAPTDYYGVTETELIEIADAGGSTVDLGTPLANPHWGALQYVTPAGLSLVDAERATPPESPTPTVLDERAEIGNLTRSIVFQGADDVRWEDYGLGAHLMVMELASEVIVDGVLFRRVGQRGRLGRYPMHWHRLSYDEDGAELGDASGHVVKNSSIWESTNRCIVVHATNGVTVQNNICYDVRGHAIFLEDSVERRNTLEGNLVLHVRNPQTPLKAHEGDSFQGGSSGLWLSTPDNVVRGNAVADAEGVGFWLSYPEHPSGPSAIVDMNPSVMAFGAFEDNVAHSNKKLGLNLDWIVTDEEGHIEPHMYSPTVDMVPDRYDNWERFQLTRFTSYKHLGGGMWNRTTWPDYVEFVSADNSGTCFDGAGAHGVIKRSLLVGKSLNVTTGPEPETPPVGFATYHSTFDMMDNVLVSFPFVSGQPSGAFRTDDYYVRPVDKGGIRNANNLLIETHPGFRSPRTSASFAFAGALWDPHGYFGPAGRYWTYDEPFLTVDTTCTPVPPAGENGVSCEGPYYGVLEFVLDRANDRFEPHMPIEVTREDASGAAVGTWFVDDGSLIDSLGNMRHFAVLRDGRYVLRFPGRGAPADVGFSIDNAATAEDTFLLGIQFAGQGGARVYATTIYDYVSVAEQPADASKEDYVAVADLAAVSASAGGTFWQDSASEVVWIKIRGGLEDAYIESEDPFSDERLYEPFYVRVY